MLASEFNKMSTLWIPTGVAFVVALHIISSSLLRSVVQFVATKSDAFTSLSVRVTQLPTITSDSMQTSSGKVAVLLPRSVTSALFYGRGRSALTKSADVAGI